MKWSAKKWFLISLVCFIMMAATFYLLDVYEHSKEMQGANWGIIKKNYWKYLLHGIAGLAIPISLYFSNRKTITTQQS